MCCQLAGVGGTWLCSALLASNLEKRSNLGEGDLWAAGVRGRSLAGLMGQGRGIVSVEELAWHPAGSLRLFTCTAERAVKAVPALVASYWEL